MAKSSRSSIRKTNRSRLKSRVFGPVEDARTKRLSEKLVELASQPKAATTDMDIEKTEDSKAAEQESKENSGHADDADMDIDDAGNDDDAEKTTTVSRKEEKRRKEAKSARIDKKRHRKPRNTVSFPKKRQPGRKVKI
ncbi:hypothetical protein KVT40_004478 [Elsinoe batatas]|uniref:DUF2423 domain-containing protein n=1 Tax=Elsinoe batatas TaxID=2601811 RepID=A0A8K0PDY8_9PEZI|nr:hypothetical protein KVT40_004478 [Elsinoe batatas]